MKFEIDFLPVGESNGDAITIRYGNPLMGYTIHVVDAGYTDTAQTMIAHLARYYGNPTRIDHVVLSHADADHATGLIDIMKHYDVGALWMNRPWIHAAHIFRDFHGNYTVDGLARAIREAYPLLAELEDIANAKHIPIYDVFAGAQVGAFQVLSPTRERYLSLIPEFDRTPTSYARPHKGGFLERLQEIAKQLASYVETWWDEQLQENPPAVSASNESSVVQLARLGDRTLLLTADAGPIALTEAADRAAALGILSPPTFVQIPHHGSRRNVTPSVLNRWLGIPVAEGSKRGTAFCSVGRNKPEYPRARVKNAFLRRGYKVISTRDSWKRHYNDMPARDGEVPVASEAFSYAYDE